jgi:hypothetical protein
MDENQLRGWHLRQPSAKLKARIFREAEVITPGWNWQPVAPALACLMFAVMIFHFNGGMAGRENQPMLCVSSGGESNVFGVRGFAAAPVNHVDCVTFDWTNKGSFQSSIGSHFGLGPATNVSN